MNYFLNSLKLIAVILLSAILIFAAALNIIFLGNKETANFFGKTLFMYGDYESKPDIENNCLYVAEKSDRAKMGVGNDIIYEDAYGEKYIGKIVGVDTTELETAYIMSDNERVAYSSVLYYCTSRSTSFYSIVKFTISISGIVGLIVLPILLITFFIVLGIAYKRNELIDEYDISESKDSSALSKPKKSASRPITLVSEPEPEKLSDEDDEVKRTEDITETNVCGY
ncbi:MAG: hypothetical protein LBL93_00790 [Ruminococcus sp.]|jgi:hypothetical protein|nr:hypothetical protein [Ruminococcus sp.]